MRLLLPLAAVCALFVAGCGETEIDTAKAESFISDTVSEQVGARVESVDCPDGLIAKKGETFECTVTGVDGSNGRVSVTEKDDKGNVTVSAAPFILVRSLEQQITDGIKEQTGFDAEVTCPEITEFEAGNTFECDTVAEGDSRAVRVTQKDDKGNVRYEFAD